MKEYKSMRGQASFTRERGARILKDGDWWVYGGRGRGEVVVLEPREEGTSRVVGGKVATGCTWIEFVPTLVAAAALEVRVEG